MKKGSGSAKGSSYERELCTRFSLWWTNGQRDDIFWRSSGSGARAKVRGRAGANTAGQHGDIAAIDPIGKPFIDAFTVEIKRGYKGANVYDLLDKPHTAAVQLWEGFLAQAVESHIQADSMSWLLITRRDRRQAFVWMPSKIYNCLCGVRAFHYGRPCPFIRFRAMLKQGVVDVSGMLLDDFLTGTGPGHVKELLDGRHD